MKKWTAWCLLIIMILGMLPLEAIAAETTIPVERVELSQTSLEMAVGEVAELKITLSPENSGDGSWIWRSSDDSVVQLIGDGLLEAVGEGAAEITLEAGGKTASCQVTVSGFALRTLALRSNPVVLVPKGITPTFYQVGENNAQGAQLEALEQSEDNGMIPYSLDVEAGTKVAVRGKDADNKSWGGITVIIPESGNISMRAVQCDLQNIAGESLEMDGSVAVTCADGQNAVSGEEGRFLLAAGQEYTYCAACKNQDYQDATVTEALEAGADPLQKILVSELWDCKSITAPAKATVRMYKRKESLTYYEYDVYEPWLVKENEDGSATYQFSINQMDGGVLADLTWRVTMDDVVKAGYWGKDQTVITITKETKPTQENDSFSENSVLLNANSQNTLYLYKGQTHQLRAYRAWEIIDSQGGNSVIMPDFTYDIITGKDVVKLEEIQAPINGENCRWKLTALKEGFAVIEVSCKAIDIFGSKDMDGTYAASDASRTGLLVVQVGGGNANVNFGIECFASNGTSGTANISFNPDAKKVWDAEFDTLYFTGTQGELKLNPKTSGELSVSYDKGKTFTALEKDGDSYTVPIESGNNILRLETAGGTAYQVVRGDQITTRIIEAPDVKDKDGKVITKKSDGDGKIEAGDYVRVYLNGLHQPIPKLAGIYNPGFGGNTDGYSQVHLNYKLEGEAVHGPGSQYDFIGQGNYLELLIPENAGETLSLTDGYIGVGVYGKNSADILQNANNHRGMTKMTQVKDATTTYHTRSILPNITIELGTESENLPPTIVSSAPKTASVKAGNNYRIGNLYTMFQDPEQGNLQFRVSANGGKWQYVEGQVYTYSTETPGTVKLTFQAIDDRDQFSKEHTITLTVTESTEDSGDSGNSTTGGTTGSTTGSNTGSTTGSTTGGNSSSNSTTGSNSSSNGSTVSSNTNSTGNSQLDFGLTQSEIAGYVTISFEDKGVRLASELNNPKMYYPEPLGTIISATKVPFKSGETIAQATLRLLDHKKIGYSYSGSGTSGFYLKAIKNFEVNNTEYDTMGEFDAGQGSGWMITWNTTFIQRGASDFKVADGDTIRWQYTCQYGADIGDPFYGNNQSTSQTGTQNQTTNTNQTDSTDQEKADAVEKLIQALPATITLQAEQNVKEASDAYDTLTSTQKALVDKTLLEKLNQAKQTIGNLKTTDAEKAAAKEVEKLIDAIGTPVTLDSEQKIQKARKAYNALSDAQKFLVSNYSKLTAAEEVLAALKNPVTMEDAYTITGDYLEKLGVPSVGSIGGEWMVIGLKRSGRTVPGEESYYKAVEQFVRENINENQQLHRAKSTDNSRLILALTAMGKDVTNVAGHNLLLGLTQMEYLQYQGINGPIWALMAFDSGNYPIPAGDVSREKLIAVILEAQLSDGGWALTGERSDPDMTGMALQALAPYVNSRADVKRAVEKAVGMLSEYQNENGSFSSVDGPNSESIAQVITGLCALGIDADTDVRFVKNGISALDALLTYLMPGGGFRHVPDGNLDGMSTEQAYYALVAYNRMLQGKTFLFDMTDVVDAGGDMITETIPESTQVPTESVNTEEKKDEGKDVLIWTGIMSLCAAAIAVVLLNRKKLFGKFL